MTTTLKFTLASILALVLLTVTELAAAEQYIEDDEYVVYYSAFSSTQITPEIAEAYGLMRSRHRGLLNISVQRKMPGGPPKAVMSQLKGYTGQLGGSEIPLDFKVVEEGPAIYYLAEFLVKEGDKLNFDIQVKPTPEHSAMKLSFSQAFFPD